MRSRPLLSSLAGSLLLAASAADAGTLTSATWLQVVSPGEIDVPITRTAAQLGATGSSTPTSISVALSFQPFVTSFFVPGTPVDLHVRLSQGGPQLITATAGMGGGTPGIPGSVAVMSAIHVGMGVDQSMFMVGTHTLVQVPLSVGKAGQFTGTLTVVGAGAALTIDFYAWTPGTLTFTGLTSKGAPLPDVVVMGSFNLTAGGHGTVTLVSPSKITADCALFSTRSMLGLTTLKLGFVPEPGALLLLGAGLIGMLSFAGHRRR